MPSTSRPFCGGKLIILGTVIYLSVFHVTPNEGRLKRMFTGICTCILFTSPFSKHTYIERCFPQQIFRIIYIFPQNISHAMVYSRRSSPFANASIIHILTVKYPITITTPWCASSWHNMCSRKLLNNNSSADFFLKRPTKNVSDSKLSTIVMLQTIKPLCNTTNSLSLRRNNTIWWQRTYTGPGNGLLADWRHQAITLTAVDWSSVGSVIVTWGTFRKVFLSHQSHISAQHYL